MKSYYSHLQSVKSEGEKLSPTQKPVFRSSAIFPVLHNEFQSTKVIFMGYWLLKRGITEIGLLYTLRDRKGSILSRNYMAIDKPKAYSIHLAEFGEVISTDFTGSLELEIFSTRDLVFPYPAFVLVYFGTNFSTSVHTVGRIYNDIEDLKANEEYKVRESGFDIYGDQHLSPFIAFTNGPIANPAPHITYEVINAEGKILFGEFTLGAIAPFETMFITLKEYIQLDNFLNKKAGTIKFGYNFEGFFPRFVVGNFENKNKTISITHSYYDSSPLKDQRSYWNRKDEAFNDSSVSIPLFIENGYFTRLALYPIFSPSDFTLSFHFYTADGHLIKAFDNYMQLRSADNHYDQVDLGAIVKKEGLDPSQTASVNIICNWNDKKKIPTRVKFGLNIGKNNNHETLPSNICFAPQVGNPNVLKKNGTFRWAPFVNVGDSLIAFTNSSFEKQYDRAANVSLSFHRESDADTIERKLSVTPNGCVELDLRTDKELKEFFNEQSGWVSAQSDNPFLNGYYFDFFESGAVAADHVF